MLSQDGNLPPPQPPSKGILKKNCDAAPSAGLDKVIKPVFNEVDTSERNTDENYSSKVVTPVCEWGLKSGGANSSVILVSHADATYLAQMIKTRRKVKIESPLEERHDDESDYERQKRLDFERRRKKHDMDYRRVVGALAYGNKEKTYSESK